MTKKDKDTGVVVVPDGEERRAAHNADLLRRAKNASKEDKTKNK